MHLPYGGYLAQFAAEARLRLPRVRKGLSTSTGPQIVVGVTSYPARITATQLALKSLMRQSLRPDHVVLVLASSEFPDRKLPPEIGGLGQRGLEILWVNDNWRSHKKLLPLLPLFPNSLLITADDDMLYPRWWLRRLLAAHTRNPSAIVAHRAREITFTPGGALAPYATWRPATARTDPRRVLPTGSGGVLYPPGSLAPRAVDGRLAMQLCPSADDIWFKAMALLAGTATVIASDHFRDFPTVRSSQTAALFHANVGAGKNDEQLHTVFDYFGLWETVRGS